MFGKEKQNIDFIIVGLGNPDEKYKITRHNAGFLAIDILAEKENLKFKSSKFSAKAVTGNINGKKVLLLKPTTYMNNSGISVEAAKRFYNVPKENIIVISDDISLDVGKLRIRRKGSAGGHNGIKSIIEYLGSDEFPRIKIGVGKKPDNILDLADYVLSNFKTDELKNLATEKACLATVEIIENGMDKAMNLYNG